MNFAYVIAEGVLDVVVLGEILRVRLGFGRVARAGSLPDPARRWLKSFKWPVAEDITRLAVPAPVFLIKEDLLVGLRNASGIERIIRQLEADHEAFYRETWRPQTAAVVMDSDSADATAESRFSEFAKSLERLQYPRPIGLDKVTRSGMSRSGVFAFPGTGTSGTIDDVLLSLGKRQFPILFDHAQVYVQDWLAKTNATDSPHEELKKPAGPSKARLSAMAALLKPAKPLTASIEDQRWIPNPPALEPGLEPILGFLEDLLGK